MVQVVGIRFRKASKVYFFDPGIYELSIGDCVVVETVRGTELGWVASPVRDMDESQVVMPLKGILRIATDADIAQAEANAVNEKTAYSICQERIAAHKLEMKLVDVEYSFDNSKVIFFFTANGRVDFRALVKNLASIFKTRIELRQIGVRDEAKMLGGLGSCGRPICCGSFLGSFQPVSIKMAKEQNLSLNPAKISGLCGRLMCCLKYEQDNYEYVRKSLPRIGKEAMTPDGVGIMMDINVIKETARVRLLRDDADEPREYPIDKIHRIEPPRGSEHFDSADADENALSREDIVMIEVAEPTDETDEVIIESD
ncbi:MAG: stage 0 sporulation family protein [Oscillospiraceae bacterium]|nr:stage 0 sporulation family protein [Oscillospiraceae bacterium]